MEDALDGPLVVLDQADAWAGEKITATD
ncbi:MAG: hypothetical protein RL748_3505, partial [Pseudomonadota bacterium]